MVMASVLSTIPNLFHLFQRSRLVPVDFFQETSVGLFTVFFPCVRYLKRLVQQIFFRRHNIHDIQQAFGSMRSCIQMYMDPTRLIDDGGILFQYSDQFLNDCYVCVLTNRRHQLYRICAVHCPSSSHLTTNAGIPDKFPYAALPVRSRIGIIASSHMPRLRSKIPGGNLRRFFPGQTGHLDLYAEFLIPRMFTSYYFTTAAICFVTLTTLEAAYITPDKLAFALVSIPKASAIRSTSFADSIRPNPSR